MHVSVYTVSLGTSDWDFDGSEKKGSCELGHMNIVCESSSEPRERKGRGEGHGAWGRHAGYHGITRSDTGESRHKRRLEPWRTFVLPLSLQASKLLPRALQTKPPLFSSSVATDWMGAPVPESLSDSVY